jgi:hypothetical protein
MSYKIFISHRSEDRSIALAISGALRLLGNDKLEPFVCENIPGGRDWRDWIHEKIIASDIMLFLYTQETADWMWCFYEIGLFRRLSDQNPRHIICVHNPSISSLPSPLENFQAYKATQDDIKKLLTDLLYEGNFTDKERINETLFSSNTYMLAVKDFLKAFSLSKIDRQYYARRALFELNDLHRNERHGEHETVSIRSDSYTMREILLSPGKSTHWHNLYDKFKADGQTAWLDQIKESIENIKRGNSPIYVMKPFKAQENKKYIPVLTRVEQIPSEDTKTTIPLKIYVIFIPCYLIEESCELVDSSRASDPNYLLKIWKTILPTSVIRVKWKGKSSPIRYSKQDLMCPPVAYAINPAFADLYNFNYLEFPDPNGDKPLTAEDLFKLVKEFIVNSETYIPKIIEDQAEISQKIIFEGSNAFAKVPLKFNDKHPFYPNSSYLPCLVSKSTVGDINGPHVTYLGVIYVRGDWAV